MKPWDWWWCCLRLLPVTSTSVQTHHCSTSYTSLSSTGPADDLQSVTMKVTVTFGQTGVVVPCKDGWTVRDLIQQATLRYRKLLEQVRWEIYSTNLNFSFCIVFSLLKKKIFTFYGCSTQLFFLLLTSPLTNCYLYIFENHYICADNTCYLRIPTFLY